MDYPVIEFSLLGNGMVIGLVAFIHVLISHGVAIGGTAMMVSLEYRAYKTNNKRLDQFARTLSKWVLIVTTTAGAITGVGIWFTTMVITPESIGSLLRIFFWAWFAEWIVFVTEVSLLLLYYYTWDKWKGAKKNIHLRVGYALVGFSWLTAAIITGVLAAKLTPGLWTETLSFWNAFFSPTYVPSLLFRTFIAILLAVSFISIIVKMRVKDNALQQEVFGVFGKWMAVTIPSLLIFGVWYLFKIPEQAYDQVIWSTGMEPGVFTTINILGLAVLIIYALWAIKLPKKVPVILVFIVWAASIGFVGEFEMVRESVRKPYVIYDYLYANGIPASKAEEFSEEGFLENWTFATVDEVTEETKYEAGRNLYEAQCLACHSIDGWRSRRAFADRVAGWGEDSLADYIETMHISRPFMPPFVGTEEEREALAHYITSEVDQANGEVAKGGDEQ